METLKGSSSRKVLKKMKVTTAVSNPDFFNSLGTSSLSIPTSTEDQSDEEEDE